MIDKLKVINFLQDLGCAKLEHLQILYDAPKDNFKKILLGNMISKKGNEKGILKRINAYPPLLPSADKLILAFKDREELKNISCRIPYLYCTYPDLEVVNIDA